MSTYPNPNDAQRFGPELPPRGMSSGTKWLLGLGLGCGVVVLLCCGGGGIFFWRAAKSLEQGVTDDPVRVREIADGITSIDVPPALRPTGGLDFIVPFSDTHLMTVAIFEGPAGEGTLFLAEFPIELEDTDPDALEKQMADQMAGQRDGPQKMAVRESRALELTIRGKPARFNIQKGTLQGGSGPPMVQPPAVQPPAVKPLEKPAGKRPEKPEDQPALDPNASKEVVGAVGAFQGKQGTALIVIQLDAQRYKEEDVEKILRSIK